LLPFFSTIIGKETVEGAPNFRDMKNGCITEMRRQIQMEIKASIDYLSMAAHFSKDTVNRPGFANFFFKSASEEREHGMKLIEYLLMRGELAEDLTDLITVPVSVDTLVLK
jgi:ferritin heavy chain